MPTQRRKEIATRLAFFVTGLIPAAWAPLIPFVKAGLGIDNGALGLLLLCLGTGSMIAMPVTGVLLPRIGPKRMILIGGAIFVLALPLLVLLDNAYAVAVVLAVVGGSLGSVDVAMNVQAVAVERDAGRPLMSGFHGQYSFGGIAGAGAASLLLTGAHPDPMLAACVVSVAGLLVLAASAGGLMAKVDDADAGDAPLFVVPHGLVIFLGLLCFLCFMSEGAVLDWSAVLLKSERAATPALAGLGFTVFAVAMTISRLSGDRIRAVLSERTILFGGGAIAAAGFALAIFANAALPTLLGFVLVGVGASNIVPVLITITGRTRAMPSGLAVASVTTLGYAGVLAGPAAIGFVARGTGLEAAFAIPLLAMLIIAASFTVGTRA
jgi:predicted MFS family arabinose efflux permease